MIDNRGYFNSEANRIRAPTKTRILASSIGEWCLNQAVHFHMVDSAALCHEATQSISSHTNYRALEPLIQPVMRNTNLPGVQTLTDLAKASLSSSLASCPQPLQTLHKCLKTAFSRADRIVITWCSLTRTGSIFQWTHLCSSRFLTRPHLDLHLHARSITSPWPSRVPSTSPSTWM